MNNKPSSSKSTKSTKSNNNVLSKLRRLKIEENLLVQSLHKLDRNRNYEVSQILELDISNDLDYKNMLKKLKDSYINVKNLFDDVKTLSCSQDLLADLELDEIKKKVLELETTLRSLKGYVHVELNSLNVSEQELLKQLEETNPKDNNTIMRRTKISSANYNQVVPSPVRLMMTSPLKCSEVQDFQDFMKNSPNRYGGWNEYHHNIFVKYWQKHFGTSVDTDFNDSLVETLAFENFLEEALFKLQGIGKESIISHIDWYKKYLYLKYKQQRAIDKWKSNRRSIRKVSDRVLMNHSDEEKPITNNQSAGHIDIKDFNQIPRKYFSRHEEERNINIATSNSRKSQSLQLNKKMIVQTKTHQKTIGPEDIERFLKPTKQWLYRNYDDKQTRQQIHFIENMEKLRTPTWRKYL